MEQNKTEESRLLPQYVQPRYKKSGTTQMFWGAFRYGMRSFIIPIDGDPSARRGGVNAKMYLQLLDEYLVGYLDEDSIFMQDNAPVHTAKIVKKWLEENVPVVLKWPPYSPDLNPIENLWKLLKERIHLKNPKLRTLGNTQEALEELIKAAVEVWEDFAEETLNHLIDTMPDRIEAVIRAGGWYTGY